MHLADKKNKKIKRRARIFFNIKTVEAKLIKKEEKIEKKLKKL